MGEERSGGEGSGGRGSGSEGRGGNSCRQLLCSCYCISSLSSLPGGVVMFVGGLMCFGSSFFSGVLGLISLWFSTKKDSSFFVLNQSEIRP